MGTSRRLPTGRVTLMFTDIEGSTQLIHMLGDEYPRALESHNELLRNTSARHNGVEVVTTGDGFLIAFDDSNRAVEAAIDAQRALAERTWPHGVSLRVRMGLHTGEPMIIDDDYIGIDVHRAARIANVAHGGQIVLSDSTNALVDRKITTKPLGVHRLKGLDRPERIFQVLDEGLPSEFPPIRSLSPPTNIPRRTDPLVGRDPEIAAVRALLVEDNERIVTLHGPGGAGKTRLALEVASGLVDSFVDGVFFIDLTSVTSAEVEMSIADVLALPEAREADLMRFIGQRHLLLVLDNFEHVIEASDRIITLVGACPHLTLLVTSQRLLRVQGERPMAVGPLDLPSDDEPETVRAAGAAAMFADRAARAQSGFTIDDTNAGTVADICRILDGLPLALELAAANMRLFSVAELRDRLRDGSSLLGRGSRDAPSRHQTITAAVDWSYQLLPRDAQKLFRRFSIFQEATDLNATQSVLNDSGEILEALGTLVDHSLLRRGESDGTTTFSMLQTIRSYALERFDEDSDRGAVRERFATHFLLAAEAGRADKRRNLIGIDNHKAALRWWLKHAETSAVAAESAVRLASALGDFWYRHGHAREGIEFLERSLELATDLRDEVRAVALRQLGILVEATRELPRARELFERALDLFQKADITEGEAASYNSLGVVMRSLGDPDSAEQLFEKATKLRRELGDDAGLSTTISNTGIAAADRGEFDRARELFEQALSLDRKLDDEWGATVDVNNLAVAHLELGDVETAKAFAVDALHGFLELGDLDGIAEALEISAAIAGATSNATDAARIAGSAGALREGAGLPLAEPDRKRMERWMVRVANALDPTELERYQAEGAAMTKEQAVDYAHRSILNGDDGRPEGSRT